MSYRNEDKNLVNTDLMAISVHQSTRENFPLVYDSAYSYTPSYMGTSNLQIICFKYMINHYLMMNEGSRNYMLADNFDLMELYDSSVIRTSDYNLLVHIYIPESENPIRQVFWCFGCGTVIMNNGHTKSGAIINSKHYGEDDYDSGTPEDRNQWDVLFNVENTGINITNIFLNMNLAFINQKRVI